MWWYVAGSIVALIAIVVVWGILHLRNSQRVAIEAINTVSIADVEALRLECERVFRDVFGEPLALDRYEESAKVLSARLDKVESLKSAFAKPDFYWHFVLPTGAFLGELLRVHCGGEWHASEGEGPEMRIPVGAGIATTYPFDKVLKQVTIGAKGDTLAYLASARQLEQAMEGVAEGA